MYILMTLLRNIWFIQMVANMYKRVQDFKNLVSLRRITGGFFAFVSRYTIMEYVIEYIISQDENLQSQFIKLYGLAQAS